MKKLKLFANIEIDVKTLAGRPYVSLFECVNAVKRALLEKPIHVGWSPETYEEIWGKREREIAAAEEEANKLKERSKPIIDEKGVWQGFLMPEERKVVALNQGKLYDPEDFLRINVCPSCYEHLTDSEILVNGTRKKVKAHKIVKLWQKLVKGPHTVKVNEIHGKPYVRCYECGKRSPKAYQITISHKDNLDVVNQGIGKLGK